MTKEELDKIIDFLELRMIMRKAEGSELNFEETQLIKLCELCSDLTKENKELKEKINTYENPEDLALMFMYCDEKAKDKIKALQERIEYLERSNNRREETIELERKENLELHNKIDKLSNENQSLRTRIKTIKRLRKKQTHKKNKYKSIIIDLQNALTEKNNKIDEISNFIKENKIKRYRPIEGEEYDEEIVLDEDDITCLERIINDEYDYENR